MNASNEATLAGPTVESRVFWASVLLLYGEIFAIRWLGVEVSIVRAFPNLVLLLILVGASVGLGRADKPRSPTWLLLTAVAVLLGGLIFAAPLNLGFLSLRFDQTDALRGLCISAFVLLSTVVSLIVLSVNIGATLGAAIGKLPGLKGYSINLLGSITGVLLFGVISWLNIPPPGWLLLLGGITYIVTRRKLVAGLTVLCVAMSCITALHSHWSPYSKLDVIPLPYGEGSVLGSGNYILNSNNHYFHFAVRTPNLNSKEVREKLAAESASSPQSATLSQYFHWLRMPFANSLDHGRVLVLGGGSGNDVDFALKNGANSVDVVEIDPVIASFGKTLHPERPYADPRVRVHVEDARTFLRYSKDKYDLIEFAYLDPGATLNTSSFIRIDNFVYTVESVKSAIDHLDKNGLAVISFATGPKHPVTRRLYRAIAAAAGSPPVALVSDEWDSVMFFFGPGAASLSFDPAVVNPLRTWPSTGDETAARPAEDDWPFLYLDLASNGVWLYLTVLFIAVLMPVFILRKAGDQGPITGSAWGNMFFLGQAFMLVEVKSITQLSLLFGATWIVTSIVTLVVLCLAFLANWIASRRSGGSVWPFYCCIFIALVVDFLFQIPQGTDINFYLLAGGAVLINCLPIFFGGLIFSSCFENATSPPAYLSANLLGVAIGGLTENLCIVTGIKSLVLVGMFLYALSFLTLLAGKSKAPPQNLPSQV